MASQSFEQLIREFMDDIEIVASQFEKPPRYLRFDFLLSSYDVVARHVIAPDVCLSSQVVEGVVVISLKAAPVSQRMRERFCCHCRSFNYLTSLLETGDLTVEERVRVLHTLEQLKQLFIRLCEDIILSVQVTPFPDELAAYSSLLHMLQPYTVLFEMYL